MRLRNVKNAKEILEKSKYYIKYTREYKGKFIYGDIFTKVQPIHLEIGMGKGDFIIDMAKKHPDINFIGIEQYESVACRAIEKLKDVDIDNLKIMCCFAEGLDEVFDSEIDVIYLNFSDPWPKKRHAKRRLTSPIFLDIYDKIFRNDCVIIQKTDNVNLFVSSIINLVKHGYDIVDYNTDLENSGIENSVTEYERKFMEQGIKINYLKAIKK